MKGGVFAFVVVAPDAALLFSQAYNRGRLTVAAAFCRARLGSGRAVRTHGDETSGQVQFEVVQTAQNQFGAVFAFVNFYLQALKVSG